MFESNCQTNWWRDVLYINNFWSINDDCVGWAWYLANDMQFFILAPILTWAMFKRPRSAFAVMCGLVLGSVIYCLAVSLTYNYPAYSTGEMVGNGGGNPPKDDPHSYENLIYIKPWARIQPYIIGMAAAYFHVNHGSMISETTFRKTAGFFALIVSFAVLCACVFAVRHEQLGGIWTNFGNAVYIALSRSVWGLGLAVIVVVCCNGAGSVINDFLGARFWTPFARIGLSAYLIHFLFILWAVGNSKVSLFFSDSSVVMLFLSLVMMTYGFGFLLGAFVEAPLRNIGKVFAR
eukprot:TRINITY_DN23182_c0_g2_i1.p1 TRINITY_DN23182_c0_g2~~TRINITY_DN23182_c0_g2_i1.p1  ORF type:complete len:291 (-),score=67.92 TRINITY_DN23182_c0_g2_i1:93-965(-)